MGPRFPSMYPDHRAHSPRRVPGSLNDRGKTVVSGTMVAGVGTENTGHGADARGQAGGGGALICGSRTNLGRAGAAALGLNVRSGKPRDGTEPTGGRRVRVVCTGISVVADVVKRPVVPISRLNQPFD